MASIPGEIMTHSIEAMWRYGAALLREVESERGMRISQVLLAQVLTQNRAYLYTHPEERLTAEVQHAYLALLGRFQQGEPLEYLCGHTEFYSHTFLVNEHVLIPRPETELLVEQAITFLQANSTNAPIILDLGTGSGAIAICLALHFKEAKITAIDVCENALAVACENAKRHACEHIQFIRSNWLQSLPPTTFDCIVSNPPYLSLEEWCVNKALHREPRQAFIGGADGLDTFREIAQDAKKHLKSNGTLLFEHGSTQAAQIRDILQQAGYSGVFSVRDFAQHERVTGAVNI